MKEEEQVVRSQVEYTILHIYRPHQQKSQTTIATVFHSWKKNLLKIKETGTNADVISLQCPWADPGITPIELGDACARGGVHGLKYRTAQKDFTLSSSEAFLWQSETYTQYTGYCSLYALL